MATDDKLAKLLEKNIEASNRTTHAVRALVRFLFIQLAFFTAAFVLWQIGLAFPDEDTCTAFGCEPHVFVSFLVLALIISGVVLSSKAGWDELGLSEVLSRHAVPYDTYDDGATGFEFWVCGGCSKSFELEEVKKGNCPNCDIPMGKVKE